MMTPEQRKEARARCEAATLSNLRLMDDGLVIEDDGSVIADFDSNHDDARLFIHARKDLPDALDTIDALEAENAALQKMVVMLTESCNIAADEIERLRAELQSAHNGRA